MSYYERILASAINKDEEALKKILENVSNGFIDHRKAVTEDITDQKPYSNRCESAAYTCAKDGDFESMQFLLDHGANANLAAMGLAEGHHLQQLDSLIQARKEQINTADVACSLIRGGHPAEVDSFISKHLQDFNLGTAESRWALRQVGLAFSKQGYAEAFKEFTERYNGLYELPSRPLPRDSIFAYKKVTSLNSDAEAKKSPSDVTVSTPTLEDILAELDAIYADSGVADRSPSP